MKNRKKIIILCFLLLHPLSACAMPPVNVEDVSPIVSANLLRETDLTLPRFSILNSLAQKDVKNKVNAVYSPASINYALAMLVSGSEGNTLAELLNFLSLGGLNKPEAEEVLAKNMKALNENNAKIANSAWLSKDYSVNINYTNTITAKYFAEVFDGINFANKTVTNEMNQWVSEKTEGKISNLFAPGSIDASTAMCLINTVYLFDSWPNAPLKVIEDIDFSTASNETKKIDMLQTGGQLLYYEGGGFIGVSVPMENTDFIVIIPDEKNRGEELTGEKYNAFLKSRRREQVVVEFPKIKMETKSGFNDFLKACGIHDVFDPGTANLTSISGSEKNENLFVSQIIQQCYLDINEEGVEAAASTVVEVAGDISRLETSQPEIKYVRADKPFYYVLTDQASNEILFVGFVANP